jgi:hypothetical protein
MDEIDKALESFRNNKKYSRQDYNWDTSINQRGVVQPQFFTPQARVNAKNNLAQNTKKWRKSRSKYMSGRPNPEHSKRMSGEGNANFGYGYTYTETTTGFSGTAKQLADKFNLPIGSMGQYAMKNGPIKSGKCKGLNFIRTGAPKRITKQASAFFIELTTNTKGSASELNKIFGITGPELISYSKKNRPLKRGKYKGLHFKRLSNCKKGLY